MKKLALMLFALLLLVPLSAFAQYAGNQAGMSQQTSTTEKASTKAVTLSGKVSDDGKSFVSDKDKSWTVSNPEALKGHEGHEVKVTAHEDAARNEIQVVSVKTKGESKETTKKDQMGDTMVARNPTAGAGSMSLVHGREITAEQVELIVGREFSVQRFVSMCNAIIWALSRPSGLTQFSFTERVFVADNGVDAELVIEVPPYAPPPGSL